MSGSNRWSVDVVAARAGARAAAGNPDPSTRMDAFRDLCGELGETANVYACPLMAARALVGEAARTFVHEMRKAHA